MSNGGHGEKISRHREKAIVALLEAPTLRDAAAQIGVGESTLQRWLADPAFADAYHQARRQVLETALAGLSAAAGKAVQTLVRVLDCDSANAAVRAAGLILDHAEKATELLDLGARVRRLEAALADPEAEENPRGRPPSNLNKRLDHLEERVPRRGVTCRLCSDLDQLAAALAAGEKATGFADNCPLCGEEIGLEAQLAAAALQAKQRAVA